MNTLRPPHALLLIRGGEGLLFGMIFSATMVYMVEAGLSPVELVLVGTALESSALVFEIPTGVLADRKSRRLSVTVGFIITGGAYLLMGSVPTFASIATASALWGLGYTFTSGAIDAWLVDEVGQDLAEPLLARTARISALSGIAGTVAGMFLASIATRIPILTGGVLFAILGVLVLVLVPEQGFSPKPVSPGKEFRESVRTLVSGLGVVRGSVVLSAMIVVAVLLGSYSEGFDRLRDAHLIRNIGVPSPFPAVVWIGMMSMATRLFVAVAAKLLERRVAAFRRPGVPLALLFVLVAATVAAFAWTRSFVASAALLIAGGTARGVIEPIRNVWVNRHIRSDVRATVLSTFGQADSLGQIALGPLVGVVATASGIPIALTAAAAVLIPAAGVALFMSLRSFSR